MEKAKTGLYRLKCKALAMRIVKKVHRKVAPWIALR